MSQQASESTLQSSAFLQSPAQAPPPGILPNFTNPEDRGPTLIIVGAILLVIMVIALVNRAYTKLCIVQKVSWDDLTISLSAVGAIIWYTICVLQIQQGVLGKHQYDVRIGESLNSEYEILSYVVSALNGPILWLTKLTFLLLYLHLFRPMKWLRINIYFGVTVFTLFYWSLSVALFILASPRPGETRAEVTLSSVRTVAKVNIPIAAGGLLIDLYLFVVPLVAIYKLQLHSSPKIGLMIIFSTGLIAVAASAVSVYFRCKLAQTEDETWIGLEAEILYLIELDVGIITACMPSFAKMLHHHLPPWAILKSRLKFGTRAARTKSSKGLLVTNQRSKTTDFNDMNQYPPHRLNTKRTAMDDDRIYLKQHALQHA